MSPPSSPPISALYKKEMNPITTNCGNSNQQNNNNKMKVSTSSSLSSPALRSVTFDSYATVVPINHINDFEQCDVNALWYSREDLKRIRADITTTLRIILTSIKRRDDDVSCHTIRGLESFTAKGSQKRLSAKRKGRLAVLNEQDFQDELSICDPIRLAAIYRIATKRSQEEAYTRGLDDAREASRICQHEEEKIIICSLSSSSSPLGDAHGSDRQQQEQRQSHHGVTPAA